MSLKYSGDWVPVVKTRHSVGILKGKTSGTNNGFWHFESVFA
jgi:hypothetical protein